LKSLIANGERLVHDQNVRVDDSLHGERQPQHHAAGVRLDRLVNEFADLGERLDLGKLVPNLLARESKHGAVHLHVLAAGKFHIEPGAEFQQGGNLAFDRYQALGRLQGARQDLQ